MLVSLRTQVCGTVPPGGVTSSPRPPALRGLTGFPAPGLGPLKRASSTQSILAGVLGDGIEF